MNDRYFAVLEPGESPDEALRHAKAKGRVPTGPATVMTYTAKDGWKCVIAQVPCVPVSPRKRRYAPEWPKSVLMRKPKGQTGRDSL